MLGKQKQRGSESSKDKQIDKHMKGYALIEN